MYVYTREEFVEAVFRSRDRALKEAAAIAENPGFIEAQDTDWDLGVNYAKGFISEAILRLRTSAVTSKEG